MSAIGVPSNANFFLQPQATDIVYAPGGKMQEVRVKHQLQQDLTAGSPLIFKLPNSEKLCYNLSQTYIKFKLRIQTVGGENVDAGHAYPANGIAHTMWKSVTLYANEQPVSSTYQPYGYKKMIEHLLQDNGQNDYYDRMWGYKKRVAPVGERPAGDGDTAIPEIDRDTARREEHFVEGNHDLGQGWKEFVMKPCLDFFETDQNIVSLAKVNWELHMVPYENTHCINWAVNYGPLAAPVQAGIAASVAPDYKLQIDPNSVKMFLRTEYLTDEAYLSVMEAGQQQGFKYNFTPTAIKTKTLSLGQQQVDETDFAPRANPVMYCHTFVDHTAFIGAKRRNPYLFRPPPTLSKMYNYKDGQMVQEQSPVDLQDQNGSGHLQLYMNNMQALGVEPYSPGLSYGYNELMNGFFFKIVSLAPAGNTSSELVPRTSQGSHDYRFELTAGADKNYEVITYIRYEPAQIIVHLDGTIENTFSG